MQIRTAVNARNIPLDVKTMRKFVLLVLRSDFAISLRSSETERIYRYPVCGHSDVIDFKFN